MKNNKSVEFWQTGKCVTSLEIIKQIRKYGSELMEKTAAQNTQEEEDSCASGGTPRLEKMGKRIGGVLDAWGRAFRAT